jgi:hypothetical protein
MCSLVEAVKGKVPFMPSMEKAWKKHGKREKRMLRPGLAYWRRLLVWCFNAF